MSHKSARIADSVARYTGGPVSPHLRCYADCFAQGKFYEAHDVLEELWLPDRHGPDGAFLKGLIQLAGAFVHLQKQRQGPAAALLRLALANLEPYPEVHWRLDLGQVLPSAQAWLANLEHGKSADLPAGASPVPLRFVA
jgi:predicted metal-dependent hydrolase